jgi:hypothetical protein
LQQKKEGAKAAANAGLVAAIMGRATAATNAGALAATMGGARSGAYTGAVAAVVVRKGRVRVAEPGKGSWRAAARGRGQQLGVDSKAQCEIIKN